MLYNTVHVVYFCVKGDTYYEKQKDFIFSYYEIIDEGANDGVELYVYKDTGTVDTLEVQYSPKVKDYRKEMGFND